LGGYTYLWEGSSLYVLITSMLTCLVHIWTNYAADTARVFTTLIGVAVISTLLLAYSQRDELYYQSSNRLKMGAFLFDCVLGLLAGIALAKNWQLGILVIVMAVVPQGLIAFADEYLPREEHRLVINCIQDIIRALTLIFVSGLLLFVWLSVDGGNMVKVGAVVVYVVLIPVITLCQDELFAPIYEVVNPW